jgi:hypothetical protein
MESETAKKINEEEKRMETHSQQQVAPPNSDDNHWESHEGK